MNFGSLLFYVIRYSRKTQLIFFSFQAWSVPEVLRPLYESSKVVAQKRTIAVSRLCLNALFFFLAFVLDSLITETITVLCFYFIARNLCWKSMVCLVPFFFMRV